MDCATRVFRLVVCLLLGTGVVSMPALAGGGGVANPLNPPEPAALAAKSGKKTSHSVKPVKLAGSLSNIPAKKLFGRERQASAMRPRSIGYYSKGCLAGAKRLEPTGPAWQAMRLSRNRNWAHPAMVVLIEKLAIDAKAHDGWNGLLVGDLTQPRGGPMLSGHASHQVGLDADVWLREMPDRVLSIKERETFQPISMLKNSLLVNPKAFTDKTVALIRRAASFPQVARVGVNPAIKLALCRAVGGDKPWLLKIQGWAGHHYHMHIRLKCPAGSDSCRSQKPPGGTSCRVAEKWYRDTKAWLGLPASEKKKRIAKKKKRKKKKKKPIALAGLPDACRTVLVADARSNIAAVIVPPVPKPIRAPAPVQASRN